MEYSETAKYFLNNLSLIVYTLEKDTTKKHKVKIVEVGRFDLASVDKKQKDEFQSLISKHNYAVSKTAVSIDKKEVLANIKVLETKKSLKNIFKFAKQNKYQFYTPSQVSEIKNGLETSCINN